MEIKTERLSLKPLTMEYFETACEYAMNPANAQMMVYLPKDSAEDVRRFILDAQAEHTKPRPDYYEFAVLLDDVHIGGVTIYFEGHFDRGELGWIINKKYWGNGYAAEAAKGVMDCFAEKMHLKRFIAHCDVENKASRSVMTKLGMTLREIHGGRRNRMTGGERLECLYEINLRV